MFTFGPHRAPTAPAFPVPPVTVVERRPRWRGTSGSAQTLLESDATCPVGFRRLRSDPGWCAGRSNCGHTRLKTPDDPGDNAVACALRRPASLAACAAPRSTFVSRRDRRPLSLRRRRRQRDWLLVPLPPSRDHAGPVDVIVLAPRHRSSDRDPYRAPAVPTRLSVRPTVGEVPCAFLLGGLRLCPPIPHLALWAMGARGTVREDGDHKGEKHRESCGHWGGGRSLELGQSR